MRLNPVFKNELKLSSRTIKMSVAVFGLNLIMAIICLVTLAGLGYRSVASGYGSPQFQKMISLYVMIAYLELGMLILFIPSTAAGSISGERERQTLEVLLTTKMHPGQIIFGKLLSSMSMAVVLAISTFPIISVAFIFGGISIFDLTGFLFGSVMISAFVGSIGIFFSALVKKTTTATILTYATIVAMILGTYALVYGIYSIAEIYKSSQLNYTPVDIGPLIYILLINPLISFFSLISSQVGSSLDMYNFCAQFGTYTNSILMRHWFWFATAIQTVISILLLIVAAKKVNPLKKR